MKAILPIQSESEKKRLAELFKETRADERRNQALAVSIHLEALAIHITKKGMNGIEAAELLRKEALRYENQSLEVH